MAKLKISKPVSKIDKDISQDLSQLLKLSVYQIEIPGVGRLRTGERHPEFHLQNIDETSRPRARIESDRAKELT